MTWFHAPPATQLGIYKAVLPFQAAASSYLDELKNLQQRVDGGRKWAMFMVAGGHFAGVVVRVSRPVEDGAVVKGKQKKSIPEMEILRHKTFHRYTSRLVLISGSL